MVLNICKIVCSLKEEYISWPKDESGPRIVESFNELRGGCSFPNVLGSVDGYHIPMPAPHNDSSCYNKKGFH